MLTWTTAEEKCAVQALQAEESERGRSTYWYEVLSLLGETNEREQETTSL